MNSLLFLQRHLHLSARTFKKTPRNLKGKSSTEQRWIVRQLSDPFVKAAHVHSYRCRSAFKLLEMDDRYGLLKPGFSVIDCGAAPGAWSQVAAQRINSVGTDPGTPVGFLVGVDLLRIPPLDGAHFLSNCDVTDSAIQTELRSLLPDGVADVILSDMAPNASGFREMDHEKLIAMCLCVVDFAEKVLRSEGALVCKYWDGSKAGQLQNRLASIFREVKVVKPKSSRKESSELFFVARYFKKQ